MDVDSLLCLNNVEKKSFKLLRMKNSKNLNGLLNDLKKSVDCAVQDTGDDVNCSKISNPVGEIDSSVANFEHVINIVSSTIEDLREISENTKINSFRQNDCAQLIVLADKDQGTFENPSKKSRNLRENNEIISRYPELFEIFSENAVSQFSDLSDNSKTEISNENNVSRQLINQKLKIVPRRSFSKIGDSEKFQVDHFDAEVKFIKESLLKPTKKKEEISSEFLEENIVPEKLSSINCEFRKTEKNERPILLFNTPSLQAKSSLSNITNKEAKIPIKRKKSNDSVHENHSSSKMKKVSSSDENVTPLFSDTILSPRNKTSNSSLNSWKTLPRNFDENNFSGFNFFARSTTSDGNQGKLKLNNRVKKTRQEFPGNLETAQGDSQVKLNNNRIFPKNKDGKTNDKIQNRIDKNEDYEDSKKKIFFDVIDILIGVKSILFENRKLVQSIQEHFQNCSIFHTIIFDDAVTLLNEGISRCTTRIQSNEKSQDLFVGANELLIESVKNLMIAVKEENEYLKQQEYYYCKHFLGIVNDNRNTGHLKRNTKHTLIGNDTLLSSSQKDRIEQLITYSVSLIKRIVPKNVSVSAENPRNSSKISPKGNPVNDMKIEKVLDTNSKNETKEAESTSKIIYPLEKPLMSKSRIKNSNNEKLTRSSTMVLSGSNAKQFSNPMIKGTNKGRTCHNTQPIWKPAGSVKISLPVKPISRQNTRLIASDKKREEKFDASIRIPTSSRSNDPKKSFSHSASQMQRSSTSVGSYDFRKKSDMNFAKTEQKPMSARIENRKCNLMTASNENTENLQNQNSGRAKWKTRQPEAIKILKELINNTSNDENEISRNCSKISDDNQISLHYLKSENKLNSSRSNLSSAMIIKSESGNISTKSIFNQEKSKILQESLNKKEENSKSQEINLTKSKNNLNKEISVRNVNSISAKLENENSVSKSSIKNSKCQISISRNNIEDKTSLNSLTSCAKKTKSEYRRPYLRKNSKDSSYLESYIRMNSRQSLASNSSKSFAAKFSTNEKKSKSSHSNAEVSVKEMQVKNENKETSKSGIVDFQSDQNISVCELRTKVSSSKSCQVSFETSTYSETSDIVFDTESNSLASDNQSSEMFIEKTEQFPEKSDKSFRTLKEILEKRGLNVDLVEDAKRKSSLTEYGSFSSILLDKEKGTIVTVCSSQTLFDKLASLSDNDIEIVAIKNVRNRFSSESFDSGKYSKMERGNEIPLGSFDSRSESQIEANTENCANSNLNVQCPKTDVNSISEIVTDRKENLEIFEIIDQIEDNAKKSIINRECFSKNEKIEFSSENYSETVKYEELSLKPEIDESCVNLKNVIEENIEKQTKILPGVEENFSFVNEILKEEVQRNRKVVNVGSISQKEQKPSQKEEENCFSVNLEGKGDNSENEIEIRCESKKEFTPVISMAIEEVIKEKEVFSKESSPVNLTSNKEITFTDNSSSEKAFSTKNSTSNEKPEFRSEDLTSNETKAVNELSNFEESSQEGNKNSKQELSSLKFVADEENFKIGKDNEANFSTKPELILQNENMKTSKGEEISKHEEKSKDVENSKDQENSKNVKNSEDIKNSKKRLESMSKLKKKLSPVKSDDERFKKRLNSVLKAIATKSESLVQETEIMKSEHHKIVSEISLENSNSFSELKILSMKIPKMNLNANSIEEISSKFEVTENNQEFDKKSNFSMKLISKLNFVPSLDAFWTNKKESRVQTEIKNDLEDDEISKNLKNYSENPKTQFENLKSENFENSKNLETCKHSDNNFKITENLAENGKKIENLFISRKRRNAQKCKYCGKRRKCSSNLSCPLEMGISVTSELLKMRNENSTPTETIAIDDNSVPTVIKNKESKVQKFTMIDTPNRLAQNLAVTTLKLATKWTHNLHKDIVLCRQCLTSRYSHDSESTNSSRRENNFELPRQNCATEKNCMGFKNAFFENEFDFSSVDEMNSKAFRRALKIFKNSSNRRENFSVNHKDNGWNKKISKQVSKSFPILVVVCFLFLWYLF